MSDALNELVHRSLITEAVTLLFVRTDQRDWPAVRECFADRVLFDMTSMTGGKPALLAADDIVAAWKRGLEPLAAVHHQVGNFLIDLRGSEAQATCYGIASHYLPNPSNANTRAFVGSYDMHLVWQQSRWLIDEFRFDLKYTEGNRDLEAAAGRGTPQGEAEAPRG
jgi:hypothetical protein